jgi:glycosyltransferase involved in cell wall biosynthesis
MKILFITPYFGGSGVDYSSTLAAELIEKGHKVTGLCFAEYPETEILDTKRRWTLRSVDRYIWKNVSKSYPWITSSGRWVFNWVLYHRWKRAVASELRNHEYDVVVASQVCTTPSVIAADEQGVPSVILTTGPAAVRYDSSNEKADKTPRFSEYPLGKKIQYPFIWAVHQWNSKAFEVAAEVITMSEFDEEVTKETFGRESTLLYIPVPLERFTNNTESGSNITLVNPRDPNKGLDTFLKIAQRFPDESFLIAGSLYDDSLETSIEKMDNVTYLGWCDDMSEVYASTKLLLMPSTYQEGGGRVVIEAFANGIPAVGSDLGGIPDYIGDGGDAVENYTDPDAWARTISQYLSDEEYYRQKSDNARERSQLFEQAQIVEKFEKILIATAKPT